MALLNNIKKMQCTPVEKLIRNYIIQNPNIVLELTTRELAMKTYTSPIAITRFCRKAGYDGFPQFKIKLANEINNITSFIENIEDTPIKSNDTPFHIMNKIKDLQFLAIEETLTALDYKKIEKLIPLIEKAQQIDLYGSGVNLHIAQEMAYLLSRIGKKVLISDSTNSRLTQAITSNNKHIAFVLSHTGETEKYVKIAKILKERNTTIIAMTGYLNSSLAKLSNFHFYISPGKRFIDMGPIIFATSTRYILYTIFASLFTYNYDHNIIASTEYAKIANYELQLQDEKKL